MSSKAETFLQETLHDLHVRSAVEETMSSMLTDLEITAFLRNELNAKAEQTRRDRRARETEIALLESRAVDSQVNDQQTALADALVHEIWKLSIELGELKRWKQSHQESIEHQDELMAKLLHAEEQIEVLKSRPAVEKKEKNSQEASDSQTEPKSEEKTAQQQEAEPDVVEEEDSKMPAKPAPESEAKKTEEAQDSLAEKPEYNEKAEASKPVSEATPNDDKDLVVSLVQEDDNEAPSLEGLDVEVLLEIFGFLHPLDILSLAQVNVAFFSRVDSLFGDGNASNPPPPSSQDVERKPAPAPTMVAIPPAPTRVVMPPSPEKPAKPAGLFSLLQTTKAPPPAASKPRADKQKGKDEKQPLSASMANSMAAKLTDAELAAIISMTEKLRLRESELEKTRGENELLTGKLEGTLGVKQFLVEKVREIERNLAKSKDDEVKVTQQIASDQEVIAFLDGRVQELERLSQSVARAKGEVEDELKRMEQRNEKKIAVLSDMLQYERERLAENEREWKATKKLLVKEIKSCRAQILALQAERDGFKEHNERLKNVVLATGALNGSPMKGR